MAPQRQAKVSTVQELLRRKSRGPEAVRKKLFTLSRLLDVQEKHEQHPFLNTALGKLSPDTHFNTVAPQFQADSEPQRDPLARENALPTIFQPYVDSKTIMEVDINSKVYQLRPFAETRLGKLPLELRTQVYHELVATPPTHAGLHLTTQGIRADKQNKNGSATPMTAFCHLQASCITVLKTCRQIYLEAHPMFYSRTSYYTANAKELQQLLLLNNWFYLHPPLRSNMITSLCVKDVVSHTDWGICHPNTMLVGLALQFNEWESLRKIYFCMHAGEEIGYIELLFRLPGMARGVIEFVDDFHWVIRPQHPEEE